MANVVNVVERFTKTTSITVSINHEPVVSAMFQPCQMAWEVGSRIVRLYTPDEGSEDWDLTSISVPGVENRVLFKGNILGKRMSLNTLGSIRPFNFGELSIKPGEILAFAFQSLIRVTRPIRPLLYIEYSFVVPT
jgi:hypothetical protein